MEKKSSNLILNILIFVAFAFAVFNLVYILSTASGISLTGMFASTSSNEPVSGSMLPYGVTFDTAGYEQLLNYYRTISLDNLTPEQKQRFIKIGTGERTGCGPCCGIQNGPGIDANGRERCGCGHNLALVGLMKLLVKDYGNKYTDDQIFNEIVKWKKLFFPGQIADDGSVIRG